MSTKPFDWSKAPVVGADPASQPKGTMGKVWRWLWKPTVTGGFGTMTPEQRQKAELGLVSKASTMPSWLRTPYVYAGEYTLGVSQRAGKIAESLTSPGSLALAALSMGESLVGDAAPKMVQAGISAAKYGAGTAFAAQGAEGALTPKQPGETTLQSARRRMISAGMGLLAGSGTAASLSDSLKSVLRSKFGLDENLAGKVASKAAEIESAKAEQHAAEESARMHSPEPTYAGKYPEEFSRLQAELQSGMEQIKQESEGMKGAIQEDLEKGTQQLKGRLDELGQRHLEAGKKLLATTAQAADQEYARVKQPFEEMAQEIKGGVTDTNSIRTLIAGSFKEAGVQDAEIPTKAYSAFPKEESSGRTLRLTDREQTGLIQAKRYLDSGMDPKEVRSALLNLGYAPKPVAAMMEQLGHGETTTATPLSFGDLTRVRGDLYGISESSGDPAIAKGARTAYERITDEQERIADSKGFGEKYKSAKAGYMKFMRSLGSGLLSKWLDASDAQSQAMAPKLRMLFSPSSAEALRTVLRSAGIDVSEIDDIAKQRSETSESLKRLPRESEKMSRKVEGYARREESSLTRQTERTLRERTKSAASLSKQAEKSAGEAGRRIEETEKSGEEVVPGKRTSELKGSTQEQLQADRIREMMSKMQRSGIFNPFALALTAIGLVRMAMGSMWGSFEVGLGGSRILIPEMVKSPGFQDWVIKQAGVDLSDKKLATGIRKGLSDLAPILRKAAQTQVPAGALKASGNQQNAMVP